MTGLLMLPIIFILDLMEKPNLNVFILKNMIVINLLLDQMKQPLNEEQ
jgi:hypothetical protein